MAHQHHDPPARERVGEARAVAHHHDAVGHASADDEYLVTPPGAGYEHTDASVWIIVKFGLWLAVSAIVIHIGMWFAFGLMVQWREGAVPEYPLAQGQEQRQPAGARLQPIPANDIYQFRTQEEGVLRNYRWIDRDGGRVQIPISEAMRLTVERGLPSRATAPDPAAPAASAQAADPAQQGDGANAAVPPLPPLGFLPSDSSAGRTMERRRQ
jgi:hypothetical protein